MIVYRIAKSQTHSQDISGMGAFKYGGRWNSGGTYMLYTSMNSSLAYLENLVHFDESESPPNLFIVSLEIKDNSGIVYELPDADYPASWQVQDNLENKLIGDRWIRENKFLAFKVRSAINPTEYNFLLNPIFPGYHDKVAIIDTRQLKIDARLIR
ncbi:MAG TPA: RES family NAD+ phosphorylase [Mucilaginibacter sp.]